MRRAFAVGAVLLFTALVLACGSEETSSSVTPDASADVRSEGTTPAPDCGEGFCCPPDPGPDKVVINVEACGRESPLFPRQSMKNRIAALSLEM